MDRIETLQLRPYRPAGKREAIALFNRLIPSEPDGGLRSILLLRDTTLDSDLCIVLRWKQEAPEVGKSRLGIQLAAVFSEFGRIDHIVWSSAGTIHHPHLGRGGPCPCSPIPSKRKE